jgi:hypothetical protein
MSSYKHAHFYALASFTLLCAFSSSAWSQNLPDADPDAHFQGKMGGTFGKDVVVLLPAYKRVAVAGFRVAFVNKDNATAQVRASSFFGRDTSGASSSTHASLAGVDTVTLQAITDKAYADFKAQLSLAGREVVPQEELTEFLSSVQATVSTVDKPYVKEVKTQNVEWHSPTGVPLWFTHLEGAWSDRGAFDLGNWKRLGEYSKKSNAIVVTPLIVVNFVAMQSSGNRSGLVARAAETSATPSMNVQVFSSLYNSPVDEGGVQMVKGVESEVSFGTLKQTAAEDNSAVKGIFDVLGKAAGLANAGGASRGSSTLVMQTTNEDYRVAAQDVLGKATGTFAKLFQKYPAP